MKNEIKAEAALAPKPWSVRVNGWQIEDSDTGLIAQTHDDRDNPGLLPHPGAIELAHEIVRSVNSHAALLAALKSIEQETWFDDGDPDEVRLAALATIADLARGALALSKPVNTIHPRLKTSFALRCQDMEGRNV